MHIDMWKKANERLKIITLKQVDVTKVFFDFLQFSIIDYINLFPLMLIEDTFI